MRKIRQDCSFRNFTKIVDLYTNYMNNNWCLPKCTIFSQEVAITSIRDYEIHHLQIHLLNVTLKLVITRGNSGILQYSTNYMLLCGTSQLIFGYLHQINECYMWFEFSEGDLFTLLLCCDRQVNIVCLKTMQRPSSNDLFLVVTPMTVKFIKMIKLLLINYKILKTKIQRPNGVIMVIIVSTRYRNKDNY